MRSSMSFKETQISKIKMQIDKVKRQKEFKERLYKFILRLIKFLGTLNMKDVVCRIIADQLTRSGTSILSNYIEGLASSSKRELIVYFERCLKSANESKVWLSVLKDAGKCDIEEANWFLKELAEISNTFGSSVLTLKGKRNI